MIVTFSYLFLVILGFSINSYKFNLMNVQPYKIFPWSPLPQYAKTPPSDLQNHLISALGLLFVTWLKIFITDSYMIDYLWTIFHYMFVIIIICNVFNLGDISKYVAGIVNISSLIMLEICIRNDLVQIYFWTLYTPIILEILLYGCNMIKCH